MGNRKYRTLFQQNDKAGSTEAGHNAITFINKGAETVYIEGVPLATTEQLQIEGNEGEVDTTIYKYYFGSGGGSQLVFILRKMYI